MIRKHIIKIRYYQVSKSRIQNTEFLLIRILLDIPLASCSY